MTNTSDGGTTTLGGCQVGILIKALESGDETVMDPSDYARFFAQEAHLRAAIEAAGMALAPLGYVRDHRVQYEVRAVDGTNAQSFAEGRAVVRTALASLVSRAQRTEPGIEPSRQVAGTSSPAGSVEDGSAVASGTRLGEPSPAPESVGGDDAVPPASDCGETPKPMPTVDDPIRDGQLRKDVKLGPPVITVDGCDVAWASALDHASVDAVGFNRSITCSFGPSERHIIDRHNTRYRSADSHPNEDIREGSVLEVDGVKTEQVLIATVSPQVELGFDEDDGEDH